MLSRLAPLLAALLVPLAACSGPLSDDDGIAPPAAGTGSGTPVAPGQGDDSSVSPTAPGPTLGVPADACKLLSGDEVVRAVGGKDTTTKATTQGQIRSCEYRVTTESGAAGSVFLDLTDQRAQQLYDIATSGVQVSQLSVGGLKASYDPSTGKVYVLTAAAFFSLQLPINLGSLTTADGLRHAAEELATAAVIRIGA
jgi:hypothetical protein